ncbi:MAG: tRNA (adenosine(37)-N6)-threonylcarbamoyltransferase complex transferase subunit TsaD [Oscillospiraceae bacterium]|jgi:N6-L-threonylcarbamoyladenine synthase|nr:tRNA (adenosine(37)-N6)-threonylcarbamoyltransferase complex transferase subunit TsaD [Oscillospiraceae bacterium]
MNILAFETSCDETAAAVVADGRAVRSSVVLSQADMHALYGGVVPEIASRRHMEAMAPLAEQALREAGLARAEIDAVAVTHAPGLIGALLVGVNFAKGAALALQKPLIPVHHIRGHLAAGYLAYPDLMPPFAALVASGGHTLLLDVRDYTDIVVAGSTCDDAAGETFDKVARALGLPYPGGAALEALAASGRGDAYRLPRPKGGDNPLDMSFSGLKTAVLQVINRAAQKGEPLDRAGLAASFTRTVAEILAGRTVQAAEVLGRSAVVLAGGVAANGTLRAALGAALAAVGRTLYVPPPALCGDNAAMIAAQAFYEWRAGRTAGMDLNGYANASAAM